MKLILLTEFQRMGLVVVIQIQEILCGGWFKMALYLFRQGRKICQKFLIKI
jgi:hypothetical protein